MPINLSICESDLHFRNVIIEHINRTLNFELLDAYVNGYELVNRIIFKQNNFLLIDSFTPIITGIEAIKILRKKNNQTPIITYSQVYQADIHQSLKEYKKVYYCQKNSTVIFALLLALLQEQEDTYTQHLDQWKKSTTAFSVSNIDQQKVFYQPSLLELQIINHASKGLTNKEIGALVHLSGRTVETYIKKLTQKFKVKNKIQLITYCVEQNLHNYK